jgi:hypothetical protein
MRLVPSAHAGGEAEDDIGHEADALRKSEFAGVLQQSVVGEHLL